MFFSHRKILKCFIEGVKIAPQLERWQIPKKKKTLQNQLFCIIFSTLSFKFQWYLTKCCIIFWFYFQYECKVLFKWHNWNSIECGKIKTKGNSLWGGGDTN